MDDGASDGTVPSLNLKLEIPNTEFARKKTKIRIMGTEVIKTVIERVRRTRSIGRSIGTGLIFPLTKLNDFVIISLDMKLTKRRRVNLSRFFFNLAQIIFAMYITGRFISPEKISLIVFTWSLFVFLLFALIGYLLDKGDEK